MKNSAATFLILTTLFAIWGTGLLAQSPHVVDDSLAQANIDAISTMSETTSKCSQTIGIHSRDNAIYTTISDWLIRLSGFYAGTFANPNAPAYLRYHHATISQTQYFLDGIPANHEQGIPFDLNALPVNAFQKATFSNQNVIELSPHEYDLKKPYSSIMWHQGYGDYSNVDVVFGMQATQKTRFIGGVNYQSGQGHYLQNTSEAVRFRGQIASDITKNWHLKYQFYRNDSNVDLPGPVFNSRIQTKWAHEVENETIQHALSVSGDIWGDSHKDITLKTYYNGVNAVWTDSTTNINSPLSDQFAGSRLDLNLPLLTEPLKISAGYEYRWIRGNVLSDTAAHHIDLRLSQQFELLPHLLADVSLSNQYNSLTDYHFSPAVSCNYQRPAFQIGADYRFTHKRPGFLPRFSDTTFLGNRTLKPEANHLTQFHFRLRPWNKTNIYFQLSHNFSEYPVTLVDNGEVFSFVNADKKSVTTGSMHVAQDFFRYYRLSVRGSYSRLGENQDPALFAEIPEYLVGATLERQQSFFEQNLKTRLVVDYQLAGNTLHYTGDDYNQFLWYRYSSSLAYTSVQHLLNLKLLLTIRDFEGFVSLRNALGSDYQWISGYYERDWVYQFGFLWHFTD